MSNKIGALSVDLSLETPDFINGLKDAQKETAAFVKELKPAINAAKELGETMSLIGDVVAIGMFEATEAAAKYGAELQHLHEKSGATVEDLSKLGFAAEQNGSSLDGLGNGLKFLSKNMELAQNGSEKQQKAFEALGISAKDVNETGGSSSAMFALLADRIKGMNDPSTHAADLVAILGKNWTELLPTLKLGSDGLKDAGDQAERLGKVISGEAAEADLQYEQTMKQVKTAIEGVSNSIASALIPQLQPLAASMRDAIADAGAFIKQHQTMAVAVFDSSAAIGAVGAALLAIGFGAGPAIRAFDNLKDVGELAMKALGSFATVAEGPFGAEVVASTGLIGAFSTAIEGAVLALSGPVGWAVAAGVVVAGLGYLFAQTETGKGLVDDFKEGVISEASEMYEAASVAGNFAESLAAIAWEDAKEGAGWVADGARSIAESIRDASAGLLDFTSLNKDDVYAAIKKNLEISVLGPWEAVKSAILANKELLKSFSDNGPPPSLLPPIPDPKDLEAIAAKMKLTAKESSDAWAESNKEIAAAQKKAQEEQDKISAAGAKQFIDDHKEMAAQSDKAMDEFWRKQEIDRRNEDTLSQASASDFITDHRYAVSESIRAMDVFWAKYDSDQKDADEISKSQAKQFIDDHKAMVDQSNTAMDEFWTKYDSKSNLARESSKQFTDAFVAAIATLNTQIGASLAKMVIDFQFNANALVDIGKKTAEGMLSAFLSGLISPLTNEFAKLGKSLADQITGGPGGGGLLGSLGGSGGLLGKLFGGLFGGGSGGSGGTLPSGLPADLGVGGSGGGGLGAIGSVVTNPFFIGGAAAAAGITAWVKSQAHWEANDLVQHFQAPFDAKVAGIVDKITNEFNDGTQNQEDIVTAQFQLHTLWKSVTEAVEAWRTENGNSSDRNKVAGQFHQTEDAFMAGQLAGIDSLADEYYWKTSFRDGTVNDAAAASARDSWYSQDHPFGVLPHYAMGTPWVPHDGPAYLHRGEAVIPAARNTGGGVPVTVTVAPTYSLNIGSGGNMRRDLIEELTVVLKNNTAGMAEVVARAVRDMMPGLVTA